MGISYLWSGQLFKDKRKGYNLSIKDVADILHTTEESIIVTENGGILNDDDYFNYLDLCFHPEKYIRKDISYEMLDHSRPIPFHLIRKT